MFSRESLIIFVPYLPLLSLCMQVALSCQNTIQQCRLFDKFCHILMAVGIPADILTETIITLGECIRGNQTNQEAFAQVKAPSDPPR